MESFVAGCLGGSAGVVVGHPFDTVKVRLQTQNANFSSSMRYKGVIDCVVKIVKNEEVTGLYKGLTPPLIGFSIQNALLFGVQHGLTKHFGEDLVSQFKAGCITGAIQCHISNSIELAKIQLQVQGVGQKASSHNRRKFNGTLSVFKHLYKSEGIAGCLRGSLATFLRDCPGYGVYFTTYAYFCHLLTPVNKSVDDIGFHRFVLAGGMTNAFSWALFFPIDVIKSKVQAEGFQPHGVYKNYMDCVRMCYLKEGLRGFTKGLLPTVVRAFPVGAATLSTVSMLLRFAKDNKNH